MTVQHICIFVDGFKFVQQYDQTFSNVNEFDCI